MSIMQATFGFRFIVRFGSWQSVQLVADESDGKRPSGKNAGEGVALSWSDPEGEHEIRLNWLPAEQESDSALQTLVVMSQPYSRLDLAVVMARVWRHRIEVAMTLVGAPGWLGHRATQKGTLRGGPSADLQIAMWDEKLQIGHERYVVHFEDDIYFYETDKIPVFRPFRIKAGTANTDFVDTLLRVAHDNRVATMAEASSQALDLYAMAYIIQHPESRLLLLLSAAELLVHDSPRSAAEIAHLDTLIALTRDSSTLTKDQRSRIIAGLGSFKRESSRTLLTRMAKQLKPRTYGGMKPAHLVSVCYSTRNDIIHGLEASRSHTPHDIFWYALNFGTMLGHLLGREFIDLAPPRTSEKS